MVKLDGLSMLKSNWIFFLSSILILLKCQVCVFHKKSSRSDRSTYLGQTIDTCSSVGRAWLEEIIWVIISPIPLTQTFMK